MPEPDVSLSETELRAAKPNFHRGRFAPALESRGKPGSPPKKVSVGLKLRPRKLDEHLNRDVARARRVALLAPMGSPPKKVSVGQNVRRSVSTVRRLNK